MISSVYESGTTPLPVYAQKLTYLINSIENLFVYKFSIIKLMQGRFYLYRHTWTKIRYPQFFFQPKELDSSQIIRIIPES